MAKRHASRLSQPPSEEGLRLLTSSTYDSLAIPRSLDTGKYFVVSNKFNILPLYHHFGLFHSVH